MDRPRRGMCGSHSNSKNEGEGPKQPCTPTTRLSSAPRDLLRTMRRFAPDHSFTEDMYRTGHGGDISRNKMRAHDMTLGTHFSCKKAISRKDKRAQLASLNYSSSQYL